MRNTRWGHLTDMSEKSSSTIVPRLSDEEAMNLVISMISISGIPRIKLRLVHRLLEQHLNGDPVEMVASLPAEEAS